MRKRLHVGLVAAGVFLSAAIMFAQGQGPQRGTVLVPASTFEHPEDIGRKAHTNHVILVRPEFTGAAPAGETPGSLACVYQTVDNSLFPGCLIEDATLVPKGGAGTIAIVDAFHYPTAYQDLTAFSQALGLPVLPQCPHSGAAGCFQVVFASGIQPQVNCGWAQEAALDIEWAHAMAPNAKIVLVEAASNYNSDLFAAVDVATNEVLCGASTCPSGGAGTGEVSMSWGSSESSRETSYDSRFTKPGVVYFAASGDSGGKVIYPSASPNVVSAGGTTINRDASGNFTSETGWSGSGGGKSKYERRPSYQNVITNIVGTQRGTPDFSFDADPYTGVSVYDSTPCGGMSGWMVFGGTSVSAPAVAGIVNLAASPKPGDFADNSSAELTRIYGSLGTDNVRDITAGKAGKNRALQGWDFVTGVGSNQGLAGK
jgi:hypothetical protein